MTKRLFVAFNLPTALKNYLVSLMSDLRGRYPQARWVETCNLHLTILFLGNQPLALLPALRQQLGRIAGRFSPLCLRLNSFCFLPSRHQPSVLAVKSRLISSSQLVAAVRQDLASLVPESRCWLPHITLARFRPPLRQRIILPSLKRLPYQLADFSLYASQLTPQGPIYQELEKFILYGED
ncbi:RNA 2',3'-cyclic phosphodiesterase [Candidatus Parcubacteria bacterium]|nr:MAG: RNA 2',3'-cyclic phosphodiesterase [Candidatus Parcubacteria bacterium]